MPKWIIQLRGDAGDLENLPEQFRSSAYFFAAFFRFANGDAALPARINAHLFLTASRIAFRPAALIIRFR
jgi:hypothetical protein